MRRLGAALLGAGVIAVASTAQAQLVLPGAMPSTAPTSVAPPAGIGAPRKGPPGEAALASAPVVKAPGEEAVAGRQLQKNGSTGVMAIEKTTDGLRIARLAFVGYQIEKPAEVCRVEVGGGATIALKPAERHGGLLSYEADLEACPFALDVLDGAVRVRGRTCDFKAADCRIDPAGVWGPPGDSISVEEAKTIERLRAKAEGEARASFRALLVAHKGDKERIKEIAREQASFSSEREVTCRDYAGEDRHGYCSARLTMAHAVDLSAELHSAPPKVAGGKAERPRHRRPRANVVAAPAPAR